MRLFAEVLFDGVIFGVIRIDAQPGDTIMAVKKNIEDTLAHKFALDYPCGQQLLICNGKVLKDETTLEEHKVSEGELLVVMLCQRTASSSGSSSAQSATTVPAAPPSSTPSPAPVAVSQTTAPVRTASVPTSATSDVPATAYGQAASHAVAGTNAEQIIQQLMDMVGGIWHKETLTRALCAAHNDLERALEYLYSSPKTAEVAVPDPSFTLNQESGGADTTTEAGLEWNTVPPSGVANSSLNRVPQEALNAGTGDEDESLDFLRYSREFEKLQSMARRDPPVLKSVLSAIEEHNPGLYELIDAHFEEFFWLVLPEGTEGDLFSIRVPPAEQETITRLEALGFDRALVIHAFLACDRNYELTANYLLEMQAIMRIEW